MRKVGSHARKQLRDKAVVFGAESRYTEKKHTNTGWKKRNLENLIAPARLCRRQLQVQSVVRSFSLYEKQLSELRRQITWWWLIQQKGAQSLACFSLYNRRERWKPSSETGVKSQTLACDTAQVKRWNLICIDKWEYLKPITATCSPIPTSAQ